MRHIINSVIFLLFAVLIGLYFLRLRYKLLALWKEVAVKDVIFHKLLFFIFNIVSIYFRTSISISYLDMPYSRISRRFPRLISRFSLILVSILGALSYGFYIKSTGDTNGEIIIGIGVLAVAFVFMPLFIFHRYKNKNIKDCPKRNKNN